MIQIDQGIRLSWTWWFIPTNEWNNEIFSTGGNSQTKLQIAIDSTSKIVFGHVWCVRKLPYMINFTSYFNWILNSEWTSLKEKDQTEDSKRVRHRIIKSNCALCFRMVAPRNKICTKTMLSKVKHKTASSIFRSVNFFVSKF